MRLAVLLALATFFAPTMAASASNFDAEFLIKRKGKVIGFHRVDVTETEFGYDVKTAIRMKVKVGPIPVFKYRHDAQETWADGELVSFSAITDRNGRDFYAKAQRDVDGLTISGTKFEGEAPDGVFPSSYWNRGLVDAGHMFNTLHGEIMEIEVASLGEKEASYGGLAEKFRIKNETDLYLWYDGFRWVGAEFTIDGEALVYELADSESDYKKIAKYDDKS